MSLLVVLMLAGCSPNDAVVGGTFHAWLAKGSSAAVATGSMDLNKASFTVDCASETPEEDSFCNFGTPNPVDSRFDEPYFYDGSGTAGADRPVFGQFARLGDDVFYGYQGEVVTWRSEAIMTSEDDFQLTVHHDLDGVAPGQDFRFAFVIDPDYQPTVCIESGQTCYVEGDNDGDGWADYNDPDCLSDAWEVGYTHLSCNNGMDDDEDGLVDGADSDCTSAFATETPQTTCGDGQDNDGDGLRDNADPDCSIGWGLKEETGASNGVYACSDELDNDGDGDVDLDDEGCESVWDNAEDGALSGDACADELDNDSDGWVDSLDSDCLTSEAESGLSGAPCGDGIDNDGDGLADAADPGCIDAFDGAETDLGLSCSDETDNDSDGYVDVEDPDCVLGEEEDDTFFGFYACNDGLDNDDTADGDIDSDDSDCTSAFDNNENKLSSNTCGSGPDDDDLDGWPETVDPDCLLGKSQLGFTGYICNNGIDDDSDALIDAEDPGCIAPQRATEDDAVSSDCSDGVDNDGDGFIDGNGFVENEGKDDEIVYGADYGCWMGGAEADDAAMQCGDSIDNDGDGFIDASDIDCVTSATLLEGPIGACDNKLDDDGDGWVDNSDPDCASSLYEAGFTAGACNDGVDNDGDADVDADDADCALASTRYESLDECGDGVDNDGDGWIDRGDGDKDLGDPTCLNGGPSEGGGPAGLTQCSDGQDNDSDGDLDRLDTDCNNAFDTVEATEDPGEPAPFPLNYGNTLEEWSKDEDGKTIYYLNAGAAQINPSDAEIFWSLPQEWLAGFAHAKFADDELIVVPNDFHYMEADATNPDPTAYAEGAAELASYAPIWAAELSTYGGMNPADFEIKVEDNVWRPIDEAEAGLDNFVETHYSFVRFEGSPTFEIGSSVKGDYQIFLQGRDSLSFAVLKGTFEVESIRKDRWSYSVLEEDKINEHVEEAEEEGTVYVPSPCTTY
jgi:hypothetical protein